MNDALCTDRYPRDSSRDWSTAHIVPLAQSQSRAAIGRGPSFQLICITCGRFMRTRVQSRITTAILTIGTLAVAIKANMTTPTRVYATDPASGVSGGRIGRIGDPHQHMVHMNCATFCATSLPLNNMVISRRVRLTSMRVKP